MNQKVSRNDPCPCGSGKKYKNCCLSKEQSKPPSGSPARFASVNAKPRSLAGRCKAAAKPKEVPTPPNLMERTFGPAIADDKPFNPI